MKFVLRSGNNIPRRSCLPSLPTLAGHTKIMGEGVQVINFQNMKVYSDNHRACLPNKVRCRVQC